jgi:uncharacterized protein YjlB
MIENIEWKGEAIALILRRGYDVDGVTFITSKDEAIQLGILKHRRGARIKAHVHRNQPRTISEVHEVLHVQYGKVEAEFYGSNGKKVASAILDSGDTILLLSGGHGFNILEDCKIIEVKQGPYYGVEEDKQLLETDSRED